MFFPLGLRRYLYNYLLFKSSNGVVYGSSRPCASRGYFINDLEKKFHFNILTYSLCYLLRVPSGLSILSETSLLSLIL